ncbi:MAG: hypothetical protein ACKOZU_02905 [Planctomycetaceae bacterium]
MPPSPQQPPHGRPPPGKPGKTTLVGGLPWQAGQGAPATPPTAAPQPAAGPDVEPAGDDLAAVFATGPQTAASKPAPSAGTPTVGDLSAFEVGPTRRSSRTRPRVGPPRVAARPVEPGWLVNVLGEEEAAEFASIPARLKARFDAWVRRSPPFTVSLCLHVVVLMVLALIFVRIDRAKRRPIDLSFASTHVVEAEKPGVQIMEPQPEPAPEPEPEVTKEEKAVEDPSAAPEATEPEKVEALGSEPAPSGAPAVGSLLDGREEGRRERLVAAYGGSDATEAAVGRALAWIVRQQGKDGLWSLQGPYVDPASQENRLAATAMALLALQGAGNTPRVGIHKRAVAAGWAALLKKQVAGGDREANADRRKSGTGRFELAAQDPPERQALYSHAQATIALCEVYGMTKDPAYEQPARRAVAYAVASQGRNGGWRYEPGQDGDMSVTGWYMMALKSAQMADIEVPKETFDGLGRFLDGVSVGDGRRYGYRFDEVSQPTDAADRKLVRTSAGPVTDAVSAEGLLCRQYLGWPRNHPALAAGVDVLLKEKFLAWETDKDVYAWYYITQVVHHLGGPGWERWNARMKEVLPAAQVSQGRDEGSWDPALDKWGPWGGRLFTTCFCTYMLEVYYRHLPLYGDEALGGGK